MPEDKSFSFEALEERFDEMLDAVLSSRRTAREPALALSVCTRTQQEFTLHWLEVIIRTNSEMGFQFVRHAARAFEFMDPVSYTHLTLPTILLV